MKLAVGVEDFLKAVFTPIWDVAVDAVSFIGGIMEPLKNVAVDAVNFLLGLLQPIFKVQVGVLQFVSGIFAPIFEVKKFQSQTSLMECLSQWQIMMSIGQFILQVFKPITDLVVGISAYIINI